MKTNTLLTILIAGVGLTNARQGQAKDINLLDRYPTTLTRGDTKPNDARPWQFTQADIFKVSRFDLKIGDRFRVETGVADLGIGHCDDGAVWAVVLPRAGGKLISSAAANPEPIANVWLRFHPAQINAIFPPETVAGPGNGTLESEMRAVASTKFRSSWHAGSRAMIPPPDDMIVDIDTRGGVRRFFGVNRKAQTAKYVAAFERRPVRLASPFNPQAGAKAFDQLWNAFDRDYAMFKLRPEVDWNKLRDEYRPQALACKSTYVFAGVCAALLRHLRDLHVWLTLAGQGVPVFNRPRLANANPSADRAILGGLHNGGAAVEWTVTANRIGYLVIWSWNQRAAPSRCDQALDAMRDTRGLIVDVRLNGGGSETLAEQVAGRFVPKEFVYAYSRYRNGPAHTDLTRKIARTVKPRGPWRYDRPVVLLIGQKCMSSNESFIGMMTGDPEVTTMGDHTCGSSGNPRIIHLPLDMTVSVPRWIDYLPDGTPLDGRGFQPQVPFKPEPGAFSGDRDDLLTAALARLSRVPLPDKPIQGPADRPSTPDQGQ